MSKISVLLSPQDKNIYNKLNTFGYNTVFTQKVSCFIPYEQLHADLQCLIIEDTAFVLSCCNKLAEILSNYYRVILCGDNISGKYPYNIPLNALVLGKYLIGRIKSVDKKIIDFCQARGYSLINVNQGYTRCSCAVVDETSIITADNSIYNALKETEIDVLKITEGFIKLDGAEYGFIGGGSGKISDDIIAFCGDITAHPDYAKIKDFCNNKRVKILSLSDEPLKDIGGIILLII